jgi:hypothetical protein
MLILENQERHRRKNPIQPIKSILPEDPMYHRSGTLHYIATRLRVVAILLFISTAFISAQQFVQQGPKLVGTGAVGGAHQGYATALSADGNTALVGGYLDNSSVGAVWVFTRIGSTWRQQGSKLVGTGGVYFPSQGLTAALSADGNTAIVGGPFDSSSAGAAWIFTRVDTTWTQQGPKLVGTGALGNALQGKVALSADGNTALVGGPYDDTNVGAAWVYTRVGNIWTQQGPKLVGTGAVGRAYQGVSVSLSSDGNTAIVGGAADNNVGAAWVYTRTGGVWTQQGSKLVGAGAGAGANQGYSVALSADGNTALLGGPGAVTNAGAAWVFTRAGNTWTQQGQMLVGVGAVGHANQGYAVALSSDGNTALLGGWADDANAGSAWIFTRLGNIWAQQGTKLFGSGAVGIAQQGSSVALSSDGNTALIGGWNDNNPEGATWVFVRGTSAVTERAVDHPLTFRLEQNYPNPFNPATKIQFTIVNRQLTILKVYDILGQEVATLVNEELNPGTYETRFDANGVASGVYFYRLQAGSFVDTRKMIVAK